MSSGQKFIKSVRSEGKSSSKALFSERGHWKVNAEDCRGGSLFYKVLVSPPPPPSLPPWSFSGSTLTGWIALGAGLSIPDGLVSIVGGVVSGHT